MVAHHSMGKAIRYCLGRFSFRSTLQLLLHLISGDVVYLHIFGQPLIFINSPAAVAELMEKRSAIYSDRAPLVMATELFVPFLDSSSPH